jgi:hypothetical protein
MDHIDLVSRLVPTPRNTIVVEIANELFLVDVARTPRDTDTVLLADNTLRRYENSLICLGVVYCAIRFVS